MTASQAGYFNLQSFDSLGAMAVGGRIYTYIAGTTTQKTAYTDSAASVAHTYTPDGIGGQYIGIDARGELPAPLFLTTGAYDITYKTSAGATVWTRKAVPQDDAAAAVSAALAASGGSALVGFIQAGTGAVATTLQAKARLQFSVTDFGATGDGATDDTTAIQNALAALVAAGGGTLFFPRGDYEISSTIAVGDNRDIYIKGEGPDATRITPTTAVTNAFTFGTTTTGSQGISDMRIWCFGATACNGVTVTGVNPFYLNNVCIDAAAIGLNIVGGQVQYITNFAFNLSSVAGIKITGAGNEQFFSNGLISNVGGSEPSTAGIWVQSTGAFWLNAVSTISTRVGMLIAPQNGELVSWLFVHQFAADTGSDSGIKFNPAAGGAVTGCTFTDCWTASSSGQYGVELNSAGGTVDGVQFNGHRSYSNWKDGYTIASTSVVNTQFNHCKASGNSQAFTGTYNGLNIAADVGQFHVLGGRYGVDGGRPDTQGRGIIVQPGTSTNFSVIGADVRGNTSDRLLDGATGTGKTITGNTGFNPVANTAITVTASPFTYTNNTGAPATVFVTGGTVSAVTLAAKAVASATNCSFAVPHGSSLIVTYSSAPTMSYSGH